MAFKKDNDPGLSPEIGRLSAQLAKDPKSKLFIPLAEEYMKAGMLDEAISTLDEGMKVHPAYMSARVLLGKAHLQKGDMDKACEQFEAVIKAVPDNLFAHKKLGEIYIAQGRREDALKSYRILSLLSPKDEELSYIVGELQAGRMPALLAPAPPEPEEEATPVKKAAPPPVKAPPAPAAQPPRPAFTPPAPPPEPADSFLSGKQAQPSEGPQSFLDEPGMVEMPVPEMETLYQPSPPMEGPAGLGEGISYEGGDAISFDMDSVPAGEEEDTGAPQGGVYELDMDAAGFDGSAMGPDEFDVEPQQGGTYELEVDTAGFGGFQPEPAGLDTVADQPGFIDEQQGGGPEFDLDSATFDMEPEPPGQAGGYSVDTSASTKIKEIFSSFGGGPAVEEEPVEQEGVYEITGDESGFDMEGLGVTAPYQPEEGSPADMPFDAAGASGETIPAGVDFDMAGHDVALPEIPFEMPSGGGEAPEDSPFGMMEPEEPFAALSFDMPSGGGEAPDDSPFGMMEPEEPFAAPSFDMPSGGGEAPEDSPFGMMEPEEPFAAPSFEMPSGGMGHEAPMFGTMEPEEPFAAPSFEMPGGDEDIQSASPFDMEPGSPFAEPTFDVAGGAEDIETVPTYEVAEPEEPAVPEPHASSVEAGTYSPAGTGEEGARKEPINTDTLAELYIKQGFYDRAIGIYQEMLRENPGDTGLKQKLEELYMLAGVASTKAATEAREEAVLDAGVYEPEGFVQPEWEAGPVEPAWAAPELPAAPVTPGPVAPGGVAGGPEVAARLEQFLDEIKRRGRQ